MTERFTQLADILRRTRDAVTEFMSMLEPAIRQATNEHERLYYHHIYEEEDHRLDRLRDLLPKIESLMNRPEARDPGNHEFLYLLQDLSLEKFGLHNFLEHLDLAIYQFKDDPERCGVLRRMRQMTHEDYGMIRTILQELGEQFGGAVSRAGSVPTDEKEEVGEGLKVFDPDETPAAGSPPGRTGEKRWTLGSLKH